jgi:protein-S-isoprenylcysteine O-methyltransferase Ste14
VEAEWAFRTAFWVLIGGLLPMRGYFPGPIPQNGPLAWIGLALLAAGIVLQATALWSLQGLYTSRLVTRGPCRPVRHPGNLSGLLCLVGIGLTLSHLVGLGLMLFVEPLVARRIEREKERLAAEPRQEYERYQQQVRWCLVVNLF